MTAHWSIKKDFCKECSGSGHGKTCRCKSFVQDVMGCCKSCGGEGMITLQTVQEGKNG